LAHPDGRRFWAVARQPLAARVREPVVRQETLEHPSVTWWHGSAVVTTGFGPAGQRVLAARTAITAGGGVTTVVVNYRDRIWWQESSVGPAGQMRPVCSAQTAISRRDWPDFIRAELRYGQFRLAGAVIGNAAQIGGSGLPGCPTRRLRISNYRVGGSCPLSVWRAASSSRIEPWRSVGVPKAWVQRSSARR
jgi:hypothetical protein